MKKILTFFGLFCGIMSMSAQTYVVTNKNAKIYDEANSKYVTLNQNNEEISAIPGMAFMQNEKTPGWIKIEYSPGLHAFIQDSAIAGELQLPHPGTYTVSNNPSETVVISQEGDNWTLTSGSKNISGKNIGNVIIFMDASNSPAYSLAQPGTEGVVINYDNAITKFF